VKAVISEIPAAVTADTLRLGIEQLEAAFGGLRDRVLIAADPGIERRASEDQGAFKRGNGFRDVLGGDAFRPETLPRTVDDIHRCLELREQLIERHGHFHGFLQWPQRLFLKRLGAAVPHVDLAIGEIEYPRRSAGEPLHQVADAGRLSIGPGVSRAVARRA
jgi:hypothetical protein